MLLKRGSIVQSEFWECREIIRSACLLHPEGCLVLIAMFDVQPLFSSLLAGGFHVRARRHQRSGSDISLWAWSLPPLCNRALGARMYGEVVREIWKVRFVHWASTFHRHCRI